MASTFELVIRGTKIAVDQNGLYRLNDIHLAAMNCEIATDSQRPGNWAKTDTAQRQIDLEIAKCTVATFVATPYKVQNTVTLNHVTPYIVVQGGKSQGTWANRRLAEKYAGWLSVEFEDEVYQVFEDVVDGKIQSNTSNNEPKLEFTPDKVKTEIQALEWLTAYNSTTINPNLIQLARDHAQNTLLKALGGIPSLPAPDTALILGVVEIAKRDLDIDITNKRVSIGRYVAAQFEYLGLGDSMCKIDRLVNGEIRKINGFKDNHNIVCELVQEYLDHQKTLLDKPKSKKNKKPNTTVISITSCYEDNDAGE